MLNILLLKNWQVNSRRFAARLKQADLVNKTDIDNKLTSFSRPFTSNKEKHLEVQKNLNSIITKDNTFAITKIRFTSNDGSQNTIVSQPKIDI